MWPWKTLNKRQKPTSRSLFRILCCSSDALSAVIDCGMLLPLPLFSQSQTQRYSPVWRGSRLPGHWRVTGLTSSFADLYLWHHYFFGHTLLKPDSVRDQAVIYNSTHTGVEQGKYRDSRIITSHLMCSNEISGWPFLNHPFRKVSTWHCYLLFLIFLAWFVLTVVSKE